MKYLSAWNHLDVHMRSPWLDNAHTILLGAGSAFSLKCLSSLILDEIMKISRSTGRPKKHRENAKHNLELHLHDLGLYPFFLPLRNLHTVGHS